MQQSVSGAQTNNEFQQIIETQVPPDEECVGQFLAYSKPSIALTLLLGALSGFMIQYYVITVTDKKLYFSKRNTWTNKIDITDAFEYAEIESASIKTGNIQADLNLRFKNGNTLKLKAMYKKHKPDAAKTPKQIGFGPFKINLKGNTAILDETLVRYISERLL